MKSVSRYDYNFPEVKNTVADLLWMRENGIETAVKKSKCPIFGICGGYQMLGEKSTDTDGVENDGSVRGMGLFADWKRSLKPKRQER